jgi:hypothetical protein
MGNLKRLTSFEDELKMLNEEHQGDERHFF